MNFLLSDAIVPAVHFAKDHSMDIDQAFADGTCAPIFESIANFRNLEKTDTGINWGVAMLPPLDSATRKNTLAGGAPLWVMRGNSDHGYDAAVAFLKYVTTLTAPA